MATNIPRWIALEVYNLEKALNQGDAAAFLSLVDKEMKRAPDLARVRAEYLASLLKDVDAAVSAISDPATVASLLEIIDLFEAGATKEEFKAAAMRARIARFNTRTSVAAWAAAAASWAAKGSWNDRWAARVSQACAISKFRKTKRESDYSAAREMHAAYFIDILGKHGTLPRR